MNVLINGNIYEYIREKTQFKLTGQYLNFGFDYCCYQAY